MIEDRLLILGLRRGRPQALRQVYDKYKVTLLRLALVLAGDPHTAEDIVHDVFVRFAQAADRIGLTGSLRSYLTTSVVNRVRNHVRDSRRQTAQSPKTVFDRGRIIMRSPFMKVAIAATVVAVCLVGVSLWKETGSSLALAEVLARMEEVQTYRLKLSTTWQVEGAESKPTAEATILVSRALGQKTVVNVTHPITGQSMMEEIYAPARGRTVITLMPNEKQYSKVELDDATMEQWERESDPCYLVERVTRCEHTRLGRSVLDGIEVEGFQTTDPNSWGGMPVAGAEIRIWAAVETRLPVRIEAGKGEPGKGRLLVVAHDFEWNVPVEATEFTPVIPDDYTPGRPMMQLGPKK